MDTALLPFALLCLTSFFTLTNPLGTMPVFLTMTRGMTDAERQSIVRRATIVSFVTLMVFAFAGQFLFKFFGISTNGFRIAGGFIIFKIGFDMLQARYTPMKLKDEEIKTYADDISITPLGIPMLCGPGAIANAIVLMQDAHTYEMKGVLIGTIAFIYLLTFFILDRKSTRLNSSHANISYAVFCLKKKKTSQILSIVIFICLTYVLRFVNLLFPCPLHTCPHLSHHHLFDDSNSSFPSRLPLATRRI